MRWCLLSVLLFSVGTAEAASLKVKGDALALGVLQENERVNSNRDYLFKTLPKELKGKKYVYHAHKAPGILQVDVEQDGELYICVFNDGRNSKSPSPKDLNLQGTWADAGKTVIHVFGVDYTGQFSKLSVKKGQKLTIPSKNKWGTIVLAQRISMGGAYAGAHAASGKSSRKPGNVGAKDLGAVLKERTEFGELYRQIQGRHKWNNDRLENEVLRQESLVLETDKTPNDIVVRRVAALIKDLRKLRKGPSLKDEAAELLGLAKERKPDMSIEEQKALFLKLAALRRKVAFQNPLLDFSNILFVKHNKQRGGDNHMVDQYLGFNQERSGGIYMLKNAFSDQSEVVSLLADVPVSKGRLEGKTIENKGSFISLDLDYDAKSILFAFTEAEKQMPKDFDPSCITDPVERLKNGHVTQKIHGHGHYYWAPERVFHVYRADLDPKTGKTSNLKQLTYGKYNDFDPCFLPSGRIAFISGRIGGNQRCGARMCSTYTLHGMMPDGSDIIRFSYHDTNEWHPSVDNNGMIVYTRWDYVDRDSDIAHHIWHCFPDGRDPRSYHGNWPDKRELRPWMEMAIRSIPGSRKYVAVAAPHHGQNYGSLVLVDINEKDDRAMSQVKRITPEVHFPESESQPGVAMRLGKHRNNGEVYGQPWALSEDYYLCVYDEHKRRYGLYLIDSFGNRELLFRDNRIACLDPIPLKTRKRPPVVPVRTYHAKADRPKKKVDLSEGVVTVMNIYESEYDWPEGTKIKELRIINLFPKPNVTLNKPNIGKAAQSLARGVLGTVPVEEDGSVHFKMPTGCAVYFQAIDDKGLCVMNMRSATYLHPGETMGCIGCHETKNTTPKSGRKGMPTALRRKPSKIKPEAAGSYPLSFARLVQPVLDKNCVECHEKGVNGKKGPSLRGDIFVQHGWSKSFDSLQKLAWGMAGGNGAIRRNKRSYSLPAKDGARVSRLYKHLVKGHHNVKLTPEETRRITLWIDCNSNFYGSYTEPKKQAKGEIVKPLLGLPAWSKFEDFVR